MSQRDIVATALKNLVVQAPVSVASVHAEAVRLGLSTTGRLGTRHRVRTELQSLKKMGRAVFCGPNQWGLAGRTPRPPAPMQ